VKLGDLGFAKARPAPRRGLRWGRPSPAQAAPAGQPRGQGLRP